MISLPVWMPGPMFFLGGSLSLVPCSFKGDICLWSDIPFEGVSVQRPPGQRPPWTETPLDRDPLGQRPLRTEIPPWTDTPWTETPTRYGKQRAVRILLESCFISLVYFGVDTILYFRFLNNFISVVK